MTQGFVDAGFRPVGGVEKDRDSIRSYAQNFHPGVSERYETPFDITQALPETVLTALDVNPCEIDVIVGGPPCPAFANIGRAKLAEINKNDPHAYLKDPRAQLRHQYLEWVDYIQPNVLLMENVPGILNWGGTNVGDEICKSLKEKGYKPVYAVLNSANYGVPQSRKRFFLVAVHKDLASVDEFTFPEETHADTKHRQDTLQLRKRSGHQAAKELKNGYRRFPRTDSDPKPLVSVQDALEDLPRINAAKDRYKRADEPVDPYRENGKISSYAERMRKKAGDSPQQHAKHTRAVTKRDLPLFQEMKEGDTYPAVIDIAERRYEEACKEDPMCILHPALVDRNTLVPPYDKRKYKDKWWKLVKANPSKTLMAHLAKDGYSHIHYDQPRMLSVREAARLQSFPDDFEFCGSMTSAFRQIGNAVPPDMARVLATAIKKILPS